MKGEYRHTMDAKGRLFIPIKLREELGEHFVLTKGLDSCLFAYPAEGWDMLEQNIRALPMSKSRDLQRFFFSAATDVEPDNQGRILVPANLRAYAGMEKEVTIIGVSGRAELWDSACWDAYQAQITTEDIAMAMEELGF